MLSDTINNILMKTFIDPNDFAVHVFPQVILQYILMLIYYQIF